MADFFGHLLYVPFSGNPEPIHVIEPLYITAAGRVTQSATTDSVQLATIGLGTAPTSDGLTIIPIATGDTGLIVKGKTGQTANLLEIQEDAGIVKLSVDDTGALLIGGALNHDGSSVGFFGTTPTSQAAAYTPTNVSTDRTYDANSTTTDELADVLGTLIADLQSYGLLQ